MNLLEELQWRGLVKDITDASLLNDLVNEKTTLYCGFDPTASSLHIGHLVPIIVLRHFQRAGNRIIALVGTGTGLIGDPSGRKTERQLLTLDQSKVNAIALREQLSRYIDFSDHSKAILVNNIDWLGSIDLITFLRDYGKHFPVNYMLAKDTVANRLESGISFTEFSYMIIQAIDFYQLFKKENCRLQIGGSDQWGNITSGIELIRRTTGETKVVGVTLPLITKSDGTKFGKSAGGSFWLDANMTHPYAIYQYFLNTADNDVIHYLKVFTFLTREEIERLAEQVQVNPGAREAQKALATEVIRMMHGEAALEEVLRMTEILFGGEVAKLSVAQLELCLSGVPTLTLQEPKALVDVLVELGAVTSKREARELIAKQSFAINGTKTVDVNLILEPSLALEKRLIVIRKGKKNYYLVEWK